MSTLILRYRLKPGVTPADFEQWVRTVDHPTMGGLQRVRRFTTYRIDGLLLGEGEPSCDYVEVFDIPDLAGFTSQDMPGETVQGIMGQFMGFVAEPEFLIAHAIAES
jgi:hypothetical protein